jgi:subtilase family serine protease
MVVAFSGTAGMIRDAFHTEIHYLEVGGQSHYANMSDPKIPQALAPVVVGVVSMHNFRPHAMYDSVPNYTNGGPCISGNSFNCYNLVPADFQTIYNLNNLYRQGITGTGQTIVVVEDSDTYSNDVALFRSTFLGKYTGTVTTTHPGSGCSDPSTNSADIEADLDAEIASAIAPNAAIQVAACADTSTFGGLIALENLTSTSGPAIMSVSYGECESTNGSSSNAAFYNAYQTAAADGVSVFVSSGDSGAASCAGNGSSYNTYDIGVTGWGETPYNVSVGGTDFEDSYNATKGSPTISLSTYWSSTNTSTDGSAKSYIPEIPWNKSCGSWLMANYLGYSTTYGSSGYCNSSGLTLTTGAAGGGPSGCATGSPSTSNWVNGTCAGYAKPSWQSGIFGNPADGVRDVPDVSLFASHGVWGHSMIMCGSDTGNGGVSCSGAISTWKLVGGTSVGTPLMAAIQALVNEKWSIRAGNPNPTYYSIAKAEFGSTGNSACYSINQPPRRGLASNCAFYDITQGDIDVPCFSTRATCYTNSGTYGVVSTQALATSGNIISSGSSYTSTPTCTVGAPSNLNTYLNPSGGAIWAGGTQAGACTATRSTSHVGSVTISAGGQGYAGGTSCTITGGGGSGATCEFSPTRLTAASAYQPAYGATPGWDFATGIGSVNAYNLVYNTAW